MFPSVQVCGGQEEPDGLQGLQTQEVPHGRHVQVRIQVRQIPWPSCLEQIVVDPTYTVYVCVCTVCSLSSRMSHI